MYESNDDAERAARAERARERGEGIRAQLLAKLKTGGPQTAADLLPLDEMRDVSLSEVAFQLDRLAEEGRAVGEPGGSYRLA